MNTTPRGENARDYTRVRAAFLALYATPPPDREPLLDSACGDDPALRAEVERLLAEHDSVGSFLAEPADLGELSAWAGGSAAQTPLPARIGRYAVRSVLGVGGMGVVYLAEQENPQRTVALKVLRPGLATPRARSRFAFEAHVLAQLHHPGIAQVFEAGEADAGEGPQPYFAMELVAGQPLVAHALANDLDVRARVEILADVCDAVHHAHQRGVIHCDLKPSNILIDEAGRPKVLDFGIARAANAEQAATLATVVTAVGVIAGTLPYMSPEQASADPDHIDVRSDVYALGVVAFECLTGQLPHALAGKNLIEALAIVREVDAPRLATVDRGLRGDLETIVAHALEKDRARRYASASELGADLRRFLRNEPLAARPPSGLYHLRKFAARHRGLVAGAGVAFLTLVIGLVTTSVLLARASRAEQLATRSADFLKDTLVRFNPGKVGGEVKLTDVLQRMSDDLAGRFADAPQMDADLRYALAQAFNTFGQPQAAERTIRPAIASQRQRMGEADQDTINFRQCLVVALRTAERTDEALAEGQALIDTLVRSRGPDHGQTLATRVAVGQILLDAGRVKEARPEIETAEEAARRVLPEEDRRRLSAIKSLARLSALTGDFVRAEALYRELLAVYDRVLGDDHPDRIATAASLGNLLVERERFAQAREILVPTLATALRVLGEDSPDTLTAKCALAEAVASFGKRREAIAMLHEVVARRGAVLGPRHSHTILAMGALGAQLFRDGQYAAAKDKLQESTAIGVELLGSTHQAVMTQQSNLAAALWRLGEETEAIAATREVLDVRMRASGAAHPYTCFVETNLASMLVKTRQLAEAEQRLVSLLPRQIAALGERHDEVLTVRKLLADVLERTSRITEAEAMLRDNVDACVGEQQATPHETFVHTARLAANLLQQRRHDEAVTLYERAVDLGKQACKPDDPELLAAREALGRSLFVLVRHADAEPHLRAALDASLTTLPASAATVAELGPLHAACVERTLGAAAAAQRLDELITTATSACGLEAEVVQSLRRARAKMASESATTKGR